MQNIKNNSLFKFRYDKCDYIIPAENIIYMEVENRILYIHTKHSLWEVPYLSIKECMRQCQGVFCRCHKSVAVNPTYVKGIDYVNKKIFLTIGETSIGRKYIPSLREMNFKNYRQVKLKRKLITKIGI